ncbi:RHTO0S05e05754g1_1 [Rhodotorula toruloides]|uniref:RING-type E3 ubiquitin transferase n=1 Tax=Rhodotorula toruloides TaxID=5286 RepID=A0A061ASN2_RHOTO|nr:RHTO0S05e05754g1_1 [Rhodotorula toruloides]
MRVQPETWSTSIRHYRSRLCLLYLLWSLSPSYTSRHVVPSSDVDLTAGPPVCTAPSPLVSSAAGTTEGTDVLREGASGRTERLTRPADQQSQTVPVTAPFDPTLADLPCRRDAAPASSSSSTYMPVKGSTSRDANTSSGWLITPSLSEKPPAVSAVVKPDAARSEGPRTPLRHSDNAGPDTAVDEASAATCASGPEPSASAATPSPSTRHRLTPLHVTLLHLHFLYATRLILHIVRNSIATALIANPLPPPFAPAPTSASFAKRIGRLRWRISTIKKRCGASILASLTVTGGLLAFLVKAWSDDSGARGWNVVACAGWYGDLRLAEGVGAVKAGARGWAPLRNVVVLELVSTLLQALLAITPLVVGLGWIPSSISATFLVPSYTSATSTQATPLYRLPTDDFLSAILSPFATNFLTNLQVLQLVLARPPSHRWFSFSTLIVLNAILLPLEELAVVREKKATEAERVCKLASAFPRRAVRAEAAGRDGEGDATCLVCFEGAFEPEGTDGGAKQVTFTTACELPCGHSFHAACLARWFALVSTCPACHRSAVSPPSTTCASDSVSTDTAAEGSNTQEERPLELPFAGATSERDTTDEYPGAAAMRRREQRRAQAALLE